MNQSVKVMNVVNILNNRIIAPKALLTHRIILAPFVVTRVTLHLLPSSVAKLFPYSFVNNSSVSLDLILWCSSSM